jgi:general secretion pathway protein G
MKQLFSPRIGGYPPGARGYPLVGGAWVVGAFSLHKRPPLETVFQFAKEILTVITPTSHLRRRVAPRNRAFTLIEILVVVVILAVLAAVVVPNVIKKIGEGRISAAKTDITTFGGALNVYAADTGQYPTTEQGLQALIQNVGNDPKWKGPYLQNETRIRPDPWGHPYKYVSPGPNGEDYFIISEGDGSGQITTASVKENQ